MLQLRHLVFICFFISGATSLIFENLWIRMLSLVFGSTTLAISSVLTSFMGETRDRGCPELLRSSGTQASAGIKYVPGIPKCIVLIHDVFVS